MARPLKPSTILRDGGGNKMINETAYKPSSIATIVEMKVTLMLDPVPGAWHEPSDFMTWLCKCMPYVQAVEWSDVQMPLAPPLPTRE